MSCLTCKKVRKILMAYRRRRGYKTRTYRGRRRTSGRRGLKRRLISRGRRLLRIGYRM